MRKERGRSEGKIPLSARVASGIFGATASPPGPSAPARWREKIVGAVHNWKNLDIYSKGCEVKKNKESILGGSGGQSTMALFGRVCTAYKPYRLCRLAADLTTE
jgi:hypothetical protein